jgi:hypothetical protein
MSVRVATMPSLRLAGMQRCRCSVVLRDVRYEHHGDIAFEHEGGLFGARAVGVPLVLSRVPSVLSRVPSVLSRGCSRCRRITDVDVRRRSLLISLRAPG